MWAHDRHQRILAMLDARGQVGAQNLADLLGVSRETIRRDLLDLDRAGRVRRVHGGAVLPEAAPEAPFANRMTTHLRAKREIARKAVGLIGPGQCVMIDAGSTTAIFAQELARLSGITVITNSVDVAQQLADRPGEPARRYRVVMLAGDFKQDPMETHGARTINDIYRYRADLALLAPWGVDATMGATNYFLHGAEIARAMVENAERTIVLADHSKVGVPARSVFCRIDEMDHLIVDAKARLRPGFDALAKAVPGLIVAE